MIGPELVLVALYGALAGGATFAGIFIVQRFERWASDNLIHIIVFAAGVLTSGALLHVTREAVRLAGLEPALLTVTLGFAAFALLEMFLHTHRRSRPDPSEVAGPAPTRARHAGHDRPAPADSSGRIALGTVAPLGLLVHSALDGVVLGVGVLATSPAWVLLLVVVAHEVPEGLAAVSAQMHAGVDRGRVFRRSAAIALATPVAAILSNVLLQGMSPRTLGLMLAVGGGSFLYVGAADLLPESGRDAGRTSALAFAAGVALMAALEFLTHGPH